MARRLAPVLLLACVSEKPIETTPPDDPDPTTTEVCVDDAECVPGREICEDGGCVPGDRNNALEEAQPLLLGEEQAETGWIFPAGDMDWFAYTSTGPEWLSFRTVVSDTLDLDTVITLYGADGAVHAEVDGYPVWPYSVGGYDSVLYAYLPSAGTWYVRVQDVTTYDEEDELEPDGARSWTYDVLVRESVGTDEPDSEGDPSIAVDIVDGSTISVVGIVLDSPGDSDFVTVDFPFDDRLLEVWGSYAIPGSAAEPLVRIDDGGTTVAEKVGLGDAGWLSWFRSHAGTFVIEATDAQGRGGGDYWFPLYFRTYEVDESHPFFGTNVYEREVEPNADAPSALPLTADPEADYDAFRLDGVLGTPLDVDWYSAESEVGDDITVRCWTDTFGSLAELDVELLMGGVVFASGTEGDEDDYYVIDAVPPAPGQFELRIVGGSGSGDGHWYRCAVFVGP